MHIRPSHQLRAAGKLALQADGEDEELVELAELERLEAAGPLDDAPLDALQQPDPRHDRA